MKKERKREKKGEGGLEMGRREARWGKGRGVVYELLIYSWICRGGGRECMEGKRLLKEKRREWGGSFLDKGFFSPFFLSSSSNYRKWNEVVSLKRGGDWIYVILTNEW